MKGNRFKFRSYLFAMIFVVLFIPDVSFAAEYDFDFWAESPYLFTIGTPTKVNLYLKNIGTKSDTYTIAISSKEAKKEIPGEDFPELIQVSLESDRIGPVSTNGIGDSFSTVTVVGPVVIGNITFKATSISNPSIYKEDGIQVKSEYATSLPEFNLIAMMGLMILASFVYFFKRQ